MREINTARGVITIRAAQVNDLEACRELRLEALSKHPQAFGGDYEASLARSTEDWIKFLSIGSESQRIFFAVHNQVLIGMMGIRLGGSLKTKHSSLIWGVYVRDEWRGLRIADALIDACKAWAREHDARRIKLGVMSTNAAAIRLYLRCGFTVYGVEPEMLFYDGVYYDELLMTYRVGS